MLLVSNAALAAKPAATSTVQFNAASYLVDETAGTVSISVTRSSSSGPLTVNYTTSDGTAFAIHDYQATSGTVSWASGDATPKTITIPLVNDGLVETDETFYVTLSNPSRGTLGTPSTAAITIKSEDRIGTLQFQAATYSVAEGAAQAIITVHRVGGRAGSVGVFYSSSDGSARAGKDYQAVSGQLNWADGDDTPKSFVVPISDDNVSEPDETVDLALSPMYGSAPLGEPSTAVLTIVNDDLAGALRFNRLSYFATEAAGVANVVVLREFASQGAISVNYESNDGSALANEDYVPISGTLTWADGDASPRTINLPITADPVQERRESVVIVLRDPTGGAAISGSSSAMVLIEDSNRPTGYALDTSGGNGGRAGGLGRPAAHITLQKSGGTGPTEILAAGTLDAGFTPSPSTPDLGPTPAIIAQDTVIPLVDYGAEPPAGTLYVSGFTNGFYISNGNGLKAEAEERATGVSIAPGVKVVIPLNTTSELYLQFTHDVVNNGTLVLADSNLPGRGGLQLYVRSYYGNGIIDASARKQHQNGGYARITAQGGIYNYGPILTFGGDGLVEDGGHGGDIMLQAGGVIENAGNLYTYGGTSHVGLGSNGGGFWLIATRGVAHAADASNRGGDGVTGGGRGAPFVFETRQSGEIRVRGEIDTSGGMAMAGEGGPSSGGRVTAKGSVVRFAGNVDARGGETVSATANGGSGGFINITGWLYDGGTAFTNTPEDDTPAGDIYLAGNIFTGGGSAPRQGCGSGGYAGTLTVDLNTQGHPLAQRLSLIGFGQVKAEGGDGAAGGSADFGDFLVIANRSAVDWTTNTSKAGGVLRNQVSISTRGGNVYADATGGTGRGGEGGDIALWGDSGVENTGAIDARGGNDHGVPGSTSATGGDGRMQGGSGNLIYFHGPTADNSGNLTTNGGTADPTLAGSQGGNAGSVWFDISGPYTQTGTISKNGGTGATPGQGGYTF